MYVDQFTADEAVIGGSVYRAHLNPDVVRSDRFIHDLHAEIRLQLQRLPGIRSVFPFNANDPGILSIELMHVNPERVKVVLQLTRALAEQTAERYYGHSHVT